MRPAILMVLSCSLILWGCRKTSDEPAQPAQAKTSALTASAEVGTLPGVAEVDALGQSSYVIPLDLPPGTAGVEPKLWVVVKGMGGHSVLGYGATLGGLSQIRRCNKTIARDGSEDGVKFTDDDALCLDGEVMVLASGTKGANGSQYRLRHDRFAKIVLHGSLAHAGQEGDPAAGWFEVFLKNGRVLRFGPNAVRKHNGVPYEWNLTRDGDRFENYVEYSYSVGAEAVTLTSIQYTKRPLSAGAHKLIFAYEPLIYPHESYFFGAKTRRTERLAAIEVRDSGDILLQRYRFGYVAFSETRSDQLITVRRCDAVNQCLPPTRIERQSYISAAFDRIDSAASTPSHPIIDGPYLPLDEKKIGPQRDLVGDFDGDGRTDLLMARKVRLEGSDSSIDYRWQLLRSNESSWQDTTRIAEGAELPIGYYDPAFVTTAVVNIEGDDRADVLTLRPDRQHFQILHGEKGSNELSFSQEIVEAIPGNEDRITRFVPLDQDGDSLTDLWLCVAHDWAGWDDGRWRYLHNTSRGTVTTFETTLTEAPCTTADELLVMPLGGRRGQSLLTVPGYKGSRVVDWAGEYQSIQVTYLHDAERATEYTVLSPDGTTRSSGLPRDLLQRWTSGQNYAFRSPDTNDDYPDELWVDRYNGFGLGRDKLVDVDGDGNVDVLRLELTAGDDAAHLNTIFHLGDSYHKSDSFGIRVYRNTGSSFVRQGFAMTAVGSAYLFLRNSFDRMVVADFSGDGLADILIPDWAGTDDRWEFVTSNGDGSFTQTGFFLDEPDPMHLAALPGETSTRYMYRVMDWADRVIANDFDHDGFTDLIFVLGDKSSQPLDPLDTPLRYYHRWSATAPIGALTSVVDGLGKRDSFGYILSRDDALAQYHEGTSAPAVDYPTTHLANDQWLVGVHSVDNGLLNGTVRHQYDYTDGLVSLIGHGALGFKQIVETIQAFEGESALPQRAQITRYFSLSYDATSKEYPFGSIPQRTVQQVNTIEDGQPYTIVDMTESVAGPRFIKLASGKQTYFDVDTFSRSRRVRVPGFAVKPLAIKDIDEGLQLSELKETRGYDDFGNLILYTKDRGDGLVDTVTIDKNDYLNDTTNWIIGKPQRRRERSCVGIACRSREYRFSYYPGTGALQFRERAPDDPAFTQRVTLQYDAYGNVRQVDETTTDAAPRTTTMDWVPNTTRPWRVITGESLEHRYVEDTRYGVLLSERSPSGAETILEYDGFFRPSKRSRQSSDGVDDGASTTIVYAPGDAKVVPGSVVRKTVTTVGGDRVIYDLDLTGRVIREERLGFGVDKNLVGDRRYRTFAYGPYGERTSETQWAFVGQEPSAVRHWGFEAGGRLTSFSDFHIDTALVTYDGNEVTTTDAAGGAQKQRFDRQDRLTEAENEAGIVTRYGYGPFDTTLSIARDASGASERTTSFEVDDYGRKTLENDPDHGPTSFEYTGFDQVKEIRDALGQTTHFSYDRLGRLVEREAGADVYSYVYDIGRFGLPFSQTSPDGVITTFFYDTFDRLHRKRTHIGLDELEVEFDYDANSRLEYVTYPAVGNSSQFKVKHEYDGAGHLKLLRTTAPNGVIWERTAANASLRTRGETFANQAKTVRTYKLDSVQPESIRTSIGRSTIQDLWYEFEPVGTLRSRTDLRNGQSETFLHDARGYLTDWTVAKGGQLIPNHADYDALGNFTSKSDFGTYVYAGTNHRLSKAGPNVVLDNLRGAVTQFGNTSINYNVVGLPIALSSGPTTWRVEYDASLERVRRHKEGEADEEIVIDDWYQRITDNVGQVEHRFIVHSDERAVAQATRRAVGPNFTTTWSYLHDDYLGSLDAVTAVGNNNAVTSNAYDPWGARRNPKDWTQPNPPLESPMVDVGFAGYSGRPDFELINLGLREYHPQAGRFLSPDPIVDSRVDPTIGHNRFAYVQNSPLTRRDPSGAIAEGVGGTAAQSMAAAERALFDQGTFPSISRTVVVHSTQWWMNLTLSNMETVWRFTQLGLAANATAIMWINANAGVALANLGVASAPPPAKSWWENSWLTSPEWKAVNDVCDWVNPLSTIEEMGGYAIAGDFESLASTAASEGAMRLLGGPVGKAIGDGFGRWILREAPPLRALPSPTDARFIGREIGPPVPASQGELVDGLKSVGAKYMGPSATGGGSIYRVDIPNGTMDIRIMPNQSGAGPMRDARTVTTRPLDTNGPGEGQYCYGDGRIPKGAIPKSERAGIGHTHGQRP